MKKIVLGFYIFFVFVLIVSGIRIFRHLIDTDAIRNPKLNIQLADNTISYHVPFPSHILYDQLSDNVLKLEVIHQKSYGRKKISTGSATVITNDGFMITNLHVIKDALRITASNSRNNLKWKVKVKKVFPQYDLAVVKIDMDFDSPFKFAQDPCVPGDEVWAMGYPIDLPLSVSKGSIGATNRKYTILPQTKNSNYYTQVSILVQRGFSGGPLINNQGELIGLITATVNQGEAYTGLSMAIPIERITKILNDSSAAMVINE